MFGFIAFEHLTMGTFNFLRLVSDRTRLACMIHAGGNLSEFVSLRISVSRRDITSRLRRHGQALPLCLWSNAVYFPFVTPFPPSSEISSGLILRASESCFRRSHLRMFEDAPTSTLSSSAIFLGWRKRKGRASCYTPPWIARNEQDHLSAWQSQRLLFCCFPSIRGLNKRELPHHAVCCGAASDASSSFQSAEASHPVHPFLPLNNVETDEN